MKSYNVRMWTLGGALVGILAMLTTKEGLDIGGVVGGLIGGGLTGYMIARWRNWAERLD